MTAYIITPEQYAQIVDALEYSTPIAEFDDMQSEATAQIEHNTALAMLKAMKPVEPIGFITEISWANRQSEQVCKITRNAQPNHDFTLPLYAKEQQ